MRMTSLIRQFLTPILATAMVGICLGQDCPTEQRDLRSYERLGPQKLLFTISSNITEIRRFLWRHWLAHKRAELIIYRATKEGMPFTERLYIEPDPSHQWSVWVEIFRGDWSTSGRPSACYRVYRVIRQKVGTNGVHTKELPDTEIRKASQYRLALVDENQRETIIY